MKIYKGTFGNQVNYVITMDRGNILWDIMVEPDDVTWYEGTPGTYVPMDLYTLSNWLELLVHTGISRGLVYKRIRITT